MPNKSLPENLKTFTVHIDSIRDTLPMTILLLQPYNKKANQDFLNFVNTKVEEIEDNEGEKKLLVKIKEAKIFESLEHNASISSLATKIISESLFVSLISQYDAFLNRLLRAIFNIKPEILNSSDRNLTFSQLVTMASLQDAREFIIEKEIETVLRKNHSEQFDYLEHKLGISLRTNLPIWKTFIEITERRNLFVHADGIVSSQYMKVCTENNVPLEDVVIGKRLDVSPIYFTNSYRCLYELSVKLTHTIWRKLLKDDLEKADRELNDLCYNLLINRSYPLADNLLIFARDQKLHFNDHFKNLFIINSSLSKYLQGEKSEAKKLLGNKDWSASSIDFKLAEAILLEKYETAYEIMVKIGKNGDVGESEYQEWPLFFEIRKDKTFKDTYKKIFGETFKIRETPMRPLQELITKELKNNPDLKNLVVTKKAVKVKENKD